ncbi:MAG: hypothetical protein IT373_17805 [Polyangiaceae bacterium]|nr:hypothetical protein [Polyangiaceae bacterium]
MPVGTTPPHRVVPKPVGASAPAAPARGWDAVLLATLVTSCGRGGLSWGDPDGGGASGGAGTGTTSSAAGSGGTTSTSTSTTGGGGTSTNSTGGGGTTTTTSTGTGGSAPTCLAPPTTCLHCVATECPVTWCNCANEGECLALFQCWQGCGGDPACPDACLAAHAGGISAAYLVGDCAATSCDASCPWGQALEPCGACAFELCAAEANACLGTPACRALRQCLSACAPEDAACKGTCLLDHADGYATLQTLHQCTQQKCPSECAP